MARWIKDLRTPWGYEYPQLGTTGLSALCHANPMRDFYFPYLFFIFLLFLSATKSLNYPIKVC